MFSQCMVAELTEADRHARLWLPRFSKAHSAPPLFGGLSFTSHQNLGCLMRMPMHKNKKNKMSSDMESVPDPKRIVTGESLCVCVHIFIQHMPMSMTSETRSSAVAVIADRTACKFAVRTPLRVHWSRHSALQCRHTYRRAQRTALCRDWRPYKRR